MADSVLAFAVEYPECEKPKFKSLYIAALTIAYLIDQAPGAALVREFSIANNRLRKEVLKQYGESTEDESLSDLL
jgi:hypothetical protein